MAPRIAQSTRPVGAGPTRIHITAAATRKAALVSAFTGSAQYPGPSLSQ
jgi:hypothetical protein